MIILIQNFIRGVLLEKGASESETRSRIASIHELKERYKRESEALKEIKRRLKDVQERQRQEKEASQGLSEVRGNAELRQMVEVGWKQRELKNNQVQNVRMRFYCCGG